MPSPALHMEKPFVWWAHKLDGADPLGNHQDRAYRVSQIDGDSDIVPPHYGFVLWRAQKRYNDHCLQFCLGGSCPLVLALMLDTLVPPHMPLVLFKVLPWCWSSKGMSLGKSMCSARPLKRRYLRILQFLLPTQSPLFLQPEVMGIYLPGTGTLGWVVWSGAGITLS